MLHQMNEGPRYVVPGHLGKAQAGLEPCLTDPVWVHRDSRTARSSLHASQSIVVLSDR